MYWFAHVPLDMVEHLFNINLVIRGHHIYKDGWDTLIIGEVLYCEWEIENYNDPTLCRSLVAVKSTTLTGALLIIITLFQVELNYQQ